MMIESDPSQAMTMKRNRKIKFGRSMLRGSMILTLVVVLMVATQLMESISITKIISTSLFTGTSPSNYMSNNDYKTSISQQIDGEVNLLAKMSSPSNVIQRRSSIATPINDDITITNMLPTPIVTQTNVQKPNRTLVIVLGNVRGGEPTWKSMVRELLDPNMADLALLIGEGRPDESSKPTLLHKRAKFIWTVKEFEDWADAMEDIPDKPHDWRERLFGMTDPSHEGNILLGAAHNISGSGALVFMFRFYLSQKIIEHNLRSIYNRFVVTRSDHYYLCAHDLSQLSNDYLWVPTGSNYFGICDRHFVASNETILSALNVLPPMVRNPEAYKVQIQARPYNTERFLLLRWEQEGLGPKIQRFNRTLFLVASSADQSRWKQKGRYIKNLGVHLKYPQEFRLSIKSCRVLQVQNRKSAAQRKKRRQAGKITIPTTGSINITKLL